jgi:hypothetical protein
MLSIAAIGTIKVLAMSGPAKLLRRAAQVVACRRARRRATSPPAA